VKYASRARAEVAGTRARVWLARRELALLQQQPAEAQARGVEGGAAVKALRSRVARAFGSRAASPRA
jgi:hypothetical protein